MKSSPSNFFTSKKLGTLAEEAVALLLQGVLSPNFAVTRMEGIGEIDILIHNSLICEGAEVKSNPGWKKSGLIAIEYESKKGKMLGPGKCLHNPMITLFISYIPDIQLAICSSPAELLKAIEQMENANRVQRIQIPDGNHIILLRPEVMVEFLKQQNSFFMLHPTNDQPFVDWDPRWNSSNNERS